MKGLVSEPICCIFVTSTSVSFPRGSLGFGESTSSPVLPLANSGIWGTPTPPYLSLPFPDLKNQCWTGWGSFSHSKIDSIKYTIFSVVMETDWSSSKPTSFLTGLTWGRSRLQKLRAGNLCGTGACSLQASGQLHLGRVCPPSAHSSKRREVDLVNFGERWVAAF